MMAAGTVAEPELCKKVHQERAKEQASEQPSPMTSALGSGVELLP